jgi:hypothetical protein
MHTHSNRAHPARPQVAAGTMKWNQLLEDNEGGTTRS